MDALAKTLSHIKVSSEAARGDEGSDEDEIQQKHFPPEFVPNSNSTQNIPTAPFVDLSGLNLQNALQAIQTIEPFDGSPKRKLENFKREFNSILPFLNPPLAGFGSINLGNFIKLRLRGEALSFIESLPQSRHLDNHDIFAALKERFVRPKDRTYFQNKLKNLTQGKLSVEELAQKCIKLARGLVNNSTELPGIDTDTRVLIAAEDCIFQAFNKPIFDRLVESGTDHEFYKLVNKAKEIEKILSTQQMKSSHSNSENINFVSDNTPKLKRQSNFYIPSNSRQNYNTFPNNVIYNRQSENFRNQRYNNNNRHIKLRGYYRNNFRGNSRNNYTQYSRNRQPQQISHYNRQRRGNFNNTNNSIRQNSSYNASAYRNNNMRRNNNFANRPNENQTYPNNRVHNRPNNQPNNQQRGNRSNNNRDTNRRNNHNNNRQQHDNTNNQNKQIDSQTQ